MAERLGHARRRGIAAAAVAATLALTGCTAVSKTTLPQRDDPRDVFVTTQDLHQPYESLGLIQVTRRGALAFGFGDPAGTDLEAAVHEMLLPQVRQMGGDGVINVRFSQTDYVLPTRILFAVLFFIPLPSEVNVSGEVVKLKTSTNEGGQSL